MRGDEEGTADLLGQGSEREPWRPPRRVVVPVAALLVVVVGVVSGASWLRHQRDLDRRAARAVALLPADSYTGLQDDGFHLRLANAGPAPVRLLDVALGLGYPVGRIGGEVAPGDDLDVVVPLGTRCDRSVGLDRPANLVVHARTMRGGVVARTVPLNSVEGDQIESAARWRCGTLPPQEALLFMPSEATLRGGKVVVTGLLQNQGNRPVTVTRVVAGAGLAVSTRLPITVAARVAEHDYPAQVSFLLQVTDCDAFARAVGGGIEEQPDRLEAYGRNDYGEGPVPLDLTLSGNPEVGDPGVLPLPLLARSCPGLVVPTP